MVFNFRSRQVKAAILVVHKECELFQALHLRRHSRAILVGRTGRKTNKSCSDARCNTIDIKNRVMRRPLSQGNEVIEASSIERVAFNLDETSEGSGGEQQLPA